MLPSCHALQVRFEAALNELFSWILHCLFGELFSELLPLRIALLLNHLQQVGMPVLYLLAQINGVEAQRVY